MNKFYRYVFLVVLYFFIQFDLFAQINLLAKKAEDPWSSSANSQLSDPTVGLLEGGYCSRLNVYQGENISFYVSTHANQFSLKIYRYPDMQHPVKEFANLKGGLKEIEESSEVWEKGCGWDPAVKDFTIPMDWKAGAYLAVFPVISDTVNPILFCVKEKDPAKRSRVLVACATNTYQAYNMFGGKSIYDAFCIEPPRATKLTFHRPFNKNDHHGVNRGSFEAYDAKLIYWLESFGYGKDVDVIAQSDLQFDPGYLNSHDILINCGHDEYWSRAMRENVEKFVDNGKHFICLSGNTCWWQVRMSDPNTLICYKDFPDEEHLNDSLTTTNWYRVLNGTNPENTFIGLSYFWGGVINYGWKEYPRTWLSPKLGYGGYAVHNSQHWVYKGTGLNNGDILGFRGDSSIVGYEADGILYKYVNGTPVPTCQDKSPANFRILGLSPVSLTQEDPGWDYPQPGRYDAEAGNYGYNAALGIFKRGKPGGGFIFNGGTVRWVWGLYSDTTAVSIITKNVLDHFLSNKFPPEITSWSPFTVKNQKCLALPMSFNKRVKDLQYGKFLTFRVEAKGYNSEKISYAWAVNDSVIPQIKGSSFIYHSLYHKFGSNTVTAFAFNDKDTASISWEVKSFEGPLAISSIPDTVIRLGQPYKYTLSYFSKSNSPVSYIENYIPKWAKFDHEKNEITGIPTCAKDSIIITAKDQYENKDTQSFTLSNSETIYVKTDTKPVDEFVLFQNYPNPFNGSTKIRFNLKSQSFTELTISNLLGGKVRTFPLGLIASGNHEVIWDGTDDSGRPVSSGVYFCQISFNSELSGNLNFSKKMSYLK